MASTAINEPPERNRTRPRCIGGAVAIAVFEGAEFEKAGIDKGILIAIPSVNASAIEARFVKAILSSIYSWG
jgi:hypothetical protein